MKDKKYLKTNLVFEPLFQGWYAWSHLISPATAAMNVTGRHLKIMKSYVQAPKVHAAAVKNPKMLGGPFIDYGGDRVDDVKELINQTLEKQEALIELSKSLKELDELLMNKAVGYSLEPLYEEVPENLKGYVELVYDLNNRPTYRLFESLLYTSKYYDKAYQSMAFWLTNNDERPFVLSTPRLEEVHTLAVDIPFDSELIDRMARMRHEPDSPEQIKDLLNLNEAQRKLFDTFLTDETPEPYDYYKGDKIRMRYFGHACILLETNELSILVDPIISYYGYQTEVSRFSDLDLPEKIDYVLITHNHQDHILFETLLPLRHKVGAIVIPKSNSGSLQDPSLKLMFNKIGFKNVIEIEEMETLKFNDCELTGIPFIGEHCDLNIRSKICHHVTIGDFKILFVADSCNVENRLYELIHKEIGDVDVIFLGMECDGAPLSWLYGPLLTEDLPRDKDNSRRLAGSNCDRGMGLIDTFNPQEVYVYAMGMEPWLEFISSIKYTDESNPIIASNNLISECKTKTIHAERLYGEKEILYDKTKENV